MGAAAGREGARGIQYQTTRAVDVPAAAARTEGAVKIAPRKERDGEETKQTKNSTVLI